MEDLKKFEEKHKESIFQTLGSQLRLWLEELMRTMWFGAKHEKNNPGKQILKDLDKYENKVINSRK